MITKLVTVAVWSNFSAHRPVIKHKLPKIKALKKPKTKIYKILFIGISTIKEKTPIEIMAIKKLLVKAASIIPLKLQVLIKVH